MLELTLVTMGTNKGVLCTSDSSTTARLRRQVRKLAGIRGYFDLIHHQKGAVFAEICFSKVEVLDKNPQKKSKIYMSIN